MQENKNQLYLEALCSGDKKVILAIYHNCFPEIQHFIVNNNGNPDDAKEIFHVALYQLTARYKVRNFEIKSTFEGYLFTTCKNLWRKELNKRKKKVRNERVLELRLKEPDHSTSILEQERWELFEDKMKLLSDNCRKILNDHFNKVPYHEIVQKFNYSNENVAFQRVFKCKKHLAELIKRDRRFRELS